MSAPLQLTYFGIHARGAPAFAIAKYGGLDIEWVPVAFADWGAMKSSTLFGQLPKLEDPSTGITMYQSMAIARYLARKTKLDGSDNDADFATTEMLIEQYRCVKSLMRGFVDVSALFETQGHKMNDSLHPLSVAE